MSHHIGIYRYFKSEVLSIKGEVNRRRFDIEYHISVILELSHFGKDRTQKQTIDVDCCRNG